MMEDSEEGSDPEQLATNAKLRSKVIQSLNIMNIEDRKKLRHNLAEAISNSEHGKELSAIFKMYLIDDDHLLSIYSRICSSLQEELGKIGQYNIEPYESVANGIYIKNHIDLHVYCSSSQDDPNITYNITKVLEESKQFSDIERFRDYPFIKCAHLETGYSIKLDISEPYDLHNSEFVNQLRRGDASINELMLFLKIWFENLFIYSGTFMTKYCLMTLIIFYLQNTNSPVLTSIKNIQETAQKSIINGINFGLNARCIPVNPTENIHQMIKGFFEFYSSLNFENIIIAPYLGKLITKADFRNKVFKYPEYEAHMRMVAALSGKPAEELETNCPVCVQDMFHLNRNIANRNIPQPESEFNFKYLKKCLDMAQEKYCDRKISMKKLYKSLLININEQLELEFNVDDSFTCDIIPLENELKSLAKFADQPLNLRKLWTKAYIAAIPQIITAVYKIDMTLKPPKENCTFKKLDETEEIPLPFKWSIRSSVDVWTGRDMQRSNATFMEYQLEQTKKLYAERKYKSEFAVQFNGFITITITKNFSSLHIEANTKEILHKKNDLRRFFGSFKWYMRTYNLRHRIHLLESQLNTNV